MSRITHVVKRSGAIVPFNQDRITNAIYRAAVAVGGRDRARAEWLSGQVVEMLEATFPERHALHIEEIQDVVEKVLIENGHAKVAKAYILYRDERTRRRQAEAMRASRPSENIPWAKIWRILDWAVTRGVHTVEALNARIRNGEFPHIVHESEAAYEDDVATAADLIAERQDELKVVIISGPSCSGKTTTTIKLEERLKRRGFKFVTLNVDNYFFDLELHPRDEFGDYDFETPQALDLPLINEHLTRLIAGEEVLIPFYDFKTQKRHLIWSRGVHDLFIDKLILLKDMMIELIQKIGTLLDSWQKPNLHEIFRPIEAKIVCIETLSVLLEEQQSCIPIYRNSK